MHLPTQAATRAELRQFGLIMAAMLILFFGGLIPWIWGWAWPVWPWIAAALFASAALVFPRGLGPIHWLWLRIGFALGWINSRIILDIAFFGMILPIGLLLRLFHDPMAKRLEPNLQTYRRPSKQPVNENLEKPF